MEADRLVYKVEDRSLLLPFYRRYLVDPVLPLLPRSLNPNTITHAGHLLNLAGTAVLVASGATGGALFVAATLLLQIYLWCDNADGAHARRTNQCSALGEFLDHGLDMLNTTYIAMLTAVGLGASPLWWVAIALVIPGAAAATYWEQSHTGVFRLGLLNQIESVTVLSTVLLLSAVFGNGLWADVAPFGLSLRLAMLLWSTSTILFGMARGMARVASAGGASALLPILVLVAFGALDLLAAASGALTTVEAVAIGASANVYFGMRMLALRLRKQPPRVDPVLLAAAVVLAGLVLWAQGGRELPANAGLCLAALACAVFGGQAALDARDGVQRLERMTA